MILAPNTDKKLYTENFSKLSVELDVLQITNKKYIWFHLQILFLLPVRILL